MWYEQVKSFTEISQPKTAFISAKKDKNALKKTIVLNS